MKVSFSSRPGRDCTVVAVHGVLDLSTEPEFRQSLEQAVASGARRVVIDLTDVPIMDSSALGALVVMYKAMRERGGSLCVAAPQLVVRAVLTITSVDRVVTVYDTVEAAEEDVPAAT